MPRTATLTETGNKNAVWSTRTINATNSHSTVNSTHDVTQQQELDIVKVGLVFRLRTTATWTKNLASGCYATANLIINADTYSSGEIQPAQTPSMTTLSIDSGNFKATKRYTQAHVDAMYFSERSRRTLKSGTGGVSSGVVILGVGTPRTHKIEYCYEHQVGGLAPIKFNKLGGLDIGKVWKIGGRSQISGTADLVYS